MNLCQQRRFLHLAAFAATLFLSLPSSPARAEASDHTLLEGARLCTSYLPRHERVYGIPEHLLAAIATTESGRYNREIGMSLPWPWTINVEGKGYFFDSKRDAIAAVQRFQARGIRSIDVGCMQVNLQHHPNAFSSLDQAFDPGYNVAYAAQFLRHNFQDEGSWRKATADYHSHTSFFGEQYARLVFSAWGRIINKVSSARATLAQTGSPDQISLPAQTTLPPDLAEGNSPKARAQRHRYHPLHMHSISVSMESSRENGVLVIRPQHVEEDASHPPSEDIAFVSHHVPDPREQAFEEKHKAPETIKVKDGVEVSNNLPAKGQFEGSHARVVHVGQELSANQPSGGLKTNSLFVFDN